MSRSSRRIRIELAYDGTDFAGWQVQPHERTVQGVLEATLTRLQGGEPVTLRGAGRTDAGAHARCQVADCAIRTRLTDDDLLYRTRRMLPDDVRVLDVRTVDAEFHSRRDALNKTYRYYLDLTGHGDPFRRRFALHHPWPIDRQALQQGLAMLPGRRDWSAFAGARCRVESRVRDLTAAEYEQVSRDEAYFAFTADGFLTHMVRNMVGQLLEVARGRRSPPAIERALGRSDRRDGGPGAPARGLHLWQVRYAGGR